MQKWLSIVGIGEDGLTGLNEVGRSLLAQATVVVGGERHLAMLPPDDPREKLLWTSPIEDSLNQVLDRRGQAVCVLASGDPMCYGIGVTFTRRVAIAEMTIVPAPSAFSLACARLGWSLTDVETLSLCGRDPNLLNAVLYPGAQILVLSADHSTPTTVAQLLTNRGYGDSQITVLERMGGIHERIIQGMASTWNAPDLADLNTIAIAIPHSAQMQLPAQARLITPPHSPLPIPHSPHTPGLPDTAYHHDGQLTKREVRAVTLSALAPLPGQLLWDVGAGCGSIGIEWMRSHRRCRAIAIEQHSTRLQYIAANAASLGVPHLKIIAGEAPIALKDLPQPDAIFIGGGLTTPDLFETCWTALPSGGRLVANAVTVEGESVLFQWQRQWGGELIRIAIQRAEPVGHFLGWKAMAPVTQWVVAK
ncbi:precorrin-6y C5,15-methyltransferase (decarboxylating) subunit CbiE [Oscillatoria sp. FACHB-1407]|uniref:precorrin-6y C5,15-methyltransferase (decarboxylating) subunit CbiE n=1 Tax=Oscillatoria sp. FACHB-1407 TaxID=2692847 RepID=UPI001689AE4B|nr:precorrin-6y C5,15-methyltransferase (decarboxylating) subunit CbiE [Oscillatoria sp. FACHB-1407]MBD2463706.1 precorrin-6y C5,15-methyltransferase (decarboxylating) subunit CbiE [Oscillatoria sp. FACHB-1407]